MGALLAIKLFAQAWWKVALAVVLTAALCSPLAYCRGRSDANAHNDAAREKANTQAVTADSAAKETAANTRRTDDARIAAQQEGLNNAIRDMPDEIPSARRRALACERLRRQGTSTVHLSACNGPTQRGQAAAGSGRAR